LLPILIGKLKWGRVWWYISVIPARLEAKTGGSQPKASKSETLSEKQSKKG
jgi:hypothetical protein